MRARTVKPEFFRDKKMAQAGPIVALVFEALWCIADDDGTAPCDPIQVKGDMFVHWDSIGVPEIAEALRHLCRTSRTELFMVGDELFCRILNWKKHQKVHRPSDFKHPKEGQAVRWNGDVPVPDDSGTSAALLNTSLPPYPEHHQQRGRGREEPDQSDPTEPLLHAVLESAPVVQFLARIPERRHPHYRGKFGNWLRGADLPPGVRITPEILVSAVDEYDGGDSPDLLLRFACRKARTWRDHAAQPPPTNGTTYHPTPAEVMARYPDPPDAL